MRIGSLFSGYGGLDIGVTAAIGGDVVWHVEYDKAPSRILDQRFVSVPNYGDVTTVDWAQVPSVDVLTAGYPCQPFSHAGKREGTNDERHLWPYVVTAIRALGPQLVVLENVRGHISLGFADVLADLAELGFAAEWGVVRASDAGAPHQRARLFVIAYPERERYDGGRAPGAAQDAQRGRPNAEGFADASADASGQRHGRRQDAGMVGRVGTPPEGGGRQTSPTRTVASNRGAEDVADSSGEGRQGASHGGEGRWSLLGANGWGDYAPAIHRWEAVIGRRAPAPTESGRTGDARLSPRFVEWMMGLPDGWVTDPEIGLSRNEQLKALGNGVVPQQAALALDVLLQRLTDDLRQSLAPL